MDEDVALHNKTAAFNETLRQQGLADLIDELQESELLTIMIETRFLDSIVGNNQFH